MKKLSSLFLVMFIFSAMNIMAGPWDPSMVCSYSIAYSVTSTPNPRDNRGLAVSQNGQYLYLGYNTGTEFKRIQLSSGTQFGGNTTDRAKNIAVDDQGRVYQTGPDGNPIKIYSSDLTTLLYSIPMTKCEGIAVTRESGNLYLYATERNAGTLSRFLLTESGINIMGHALNGLDGDGVITITGGSGIRGVAVGADGKILIANPGAGIISKLNSNGSGQVDYHYAANDNPYYFAFIDGQVFVTHMNYAGGTRVAVIKYSDMTLVGNIIPPFATLGLQTTDAGDAISGIAAFPNKQGFYITYENGQAANNSFYEPIIKVSFPPEINLYVSTSTSSPYGSTIYPNTSWNTPLTTVPDGFNWTPTAINHDWTYKGKTGTFYIIPVGALSPPRSFNAATIKLVWNPSVVSGVAVTEGNFFNDGGQPSLFTTNRGSNWVIIDASCLTQNQTPDGAKSIASLDFAFNGTESGFSSIAIDAVTLLYMDGSNEIEVRTATQNMGGKIKCFLGDFASTGPPISYDIGDGLITGTDLSGFSIAYWSNYNDLPTTLYKSKYDIGPTTPVRYYFGKPTPDGTIGFEDLAIFAMGYSKTASGTLPDNPTPIVFSLDKISKEANGTLRLPVKISGSVNDLRAYSMKLNYSSDMEYTGVEMAGEMLEGMNFLIGKSETGKAYADGAFLGTGTGLSKEGVIVYVLFNEKTPGNHNANIESVIARNSGNLDLEVSFAGSNNGLGVPKTFSLNQNYPNPFNPVTKIEYALPNDMKVTIKVYDMIGREVSVLVNEIKKAGYYSVEWNGNQLSSGVYFYKMQAGDFNAVKKMLMIK